MRILILEEYFTPQSIIYSPAHHADGIIRKTKEEAVQNEAEFDGVTTE